MDIREVLATGQSKANTKAIVDHIGSDEDRFAVLMDIFLEGEYRMTQRAAWPMSVCAEEHPELIQPYFPELIELLPNSDVHNAVKRNIVRLLQYVEIPEKMAGKIFSHCVDRVEDPKEAIAIRSLALTVAAKIADGNEDLLSELRLVSESSLPTATAAFRVRFDRIFK